MTPLKKPGFSEGMIAGHDVGLEIARIEIRRAIAKPLRELRAFFDPKMKRNVSYAQVSAAIRAIDRATKAPKRKAALRDAGRLP